MVCANIKHNTTATATHHNRTAATLPKASLAYSLSSNTRTKSDVLCWAVQTLPALPAVAGKCTCGRADCPHSTPYPAPAPAPEHKTVGQIGSHNSIDGALQLSQVPSAKELPASSSRIHAVLAQLPCKFLHTSLSMQHQLLRSSPSTHTPHIHTLLHTHPGNLQQHTRPTAVRSTLACTKTTVCWQTTTPTKSSTAASCICMMQESAKQTKQCMQQGQGHHPQKNPAGQQNLGMRDRNRASRRDQRPDARCLPGCI
jgi:hypothetical protein